MFKHKKIDLRLFLSLLIGATLLGTISLGAPIEPSPVRPPGSKPVHSRGYRILRVGYSFPLGFDLAYEECGETIWGIGIARNSADNVYIEQDQQFYSIELLALTGKFGYRSWSFQFSPNSRYDAYVVLRPAFVSWKAKTSDIFGGSLAYEGNVYSLGGEVDNNITFNRIVLNATGGLSINLLNLNSNNVVSSTFLLPYFEVSVGFSF